MSIAEKNEPKTTGAPGLVSWTSATPESASAICSARPPATETGAVAPASRNGVTSTGWRAVAHAVSASTISSSQTSGLFGLTMPRIAGSAASRRVPAVGDRRELDRVLRLRPRGAVTDEGLVRPAHRRVVVLEVPAELGQLRGLRPTALHQGERARGVGEPHDLVVVGQRALATPSLEVRDERRAARVGADQAAVADPQRALRVARAHREALGRAGRELADQLRIPAHARAVDRLAMRAQQRERALVMHLRADLGENRHGLRLDAIQGRLREYVPREEHLRPSSCAARPAPSGCRGRRGTARDRGASPRRARARRARGRAASRT